MTVVTKGIPQGKVLAALYNNSRSQGLGFIHAQSGDMTEKQADALLSKGKYFDYLQGRVMKVDLADSDEFEERLYDRDLGPGAAQRAIDGISQPA